jgi:HSP20 family protein
MDVNEATGFASNVAAKPPMAAAQREVARHPLVALREEMDRLFDDFFTGLPTTPFRRRGMAADPWRRLQGLFESTFPTTDVVESEKDYLITAELPGMSENDIEIALAGDMLTLKGEKKEEREEKGANRYVAERRYGAFARSFPLPEDADPGQVAAVFKNGVLTVTLPKTEPTAPKSKRIAINGAS